MSNPGFRPQGNSILVLTSSSTGQPAQQISTAGIVETYIANSSTVPIYVAFGSSLVAAAVPTTATPAAGMCFPSGSGGVLATGPNPTVNWISAVTSAGSAPGVYATPGSGQ